MQPTLPDYHHLLSAVKQRVREAQYRALQQVNQQQIQLYWDLGQLIAERQQQHGWGRSVVETLARDLQTEFVGDEWVFGIQLVANADVEHPKRFGSPSGARDISVATG